MLKLVVGVNVARNGVPVQPGGQIRYPNKLRPQCIPALTQRTRRLCVLVEKIVIRELQDGNVGLVARRNRDTIGRANVACSSDGNCILLFDGQAIPPGVDCGSVGIDCRRSS